MGAPKVQFDRVCACLFNLLDDDVPRIRIRVNHETHDHHVVWVSPLDLLDLNQVVLKRTVGDELDIVEPHHALTVDIDRAVPAVHILDRITERLPHRSSPACIERTRYLITSIGRRCGCKPKRVR